VTISLPSNLRAREFQMRNR